MSQQTSKLLAIGLFLSLIANVFAAGYVIGKPDPDQRKRIISQKSEHRGGRDARRFDGDVEIGLIRDMMRDENHDNMRDAMREMRGKFPNRMEGYKAVLANRIKLYEQLLAEDIDEAAIMETFDESDQLRRKGRVSMRDLLLNSMKTLPQEKRKELLEKRLEKDKSWLEAIESGRYKDRSRRERERR